MGLFFLGFGVVFLSSVIEISFHGFAKLDMCSKSYVKISPPIFSYMERTVDSGIPWASAASLQDKRFYNYKPLKSRSLKGKPKSQPLYLLQVSAGMQLEAYTSLYVFNHVLPFDMVPCQK